MKLELKHLAAYLPHGLKWLHQRLDGERIIVEMTGLQNDDNELDVIFIDRGVTEWLSDLDYGVFIEKTNPSIKPLLRPLSDYKELVSHAMSDLGTDFDIEVQINELANKETSLGMVCKAAIDIMNEHHIDYYGLIEQGLAIDKTLER